MVRSGSRGWVFWLASSLLALAFLLSLRGGAEAQAGGAVLVRIKADGRDAQGEVKVMTAEADPREVAKGPSGRPISVPSGRYDVIVTCTDMVDHPEQQLRDVAVSGGTVEREVSFPSGTLTLHVKVGRAEQRGKALTLLKGGAPLPGAVKAGEAFKISPGIYEAEIVVGRKMKHTIKGIQAYDGATRHIPVEL